MLLLRAKNKAVKQEIQYQQFQKNSRFQFYPIKEAPAYPTNFLYRIRFGATSPKRFLRFSSYSE